MRERHSQYRQTPDRGDCQICRAEPEGQLPALRVLETVEQNPRVEKYGGLPRVGSSAHCQWVDLNGKHPAWKGEEGPRMSSRCRRSVFPG